MSKKTAAAIAAEQIPDTTPETAPMTDELPAASLEELEQFDLGTVQPEERAEYDRLKVLADEQIARITEKVEAAKRRMENGTAYLTSCLADFFRTVPHKATKTTEKYRLLSGTLTLKKGGVKTVQDDEKLVAWLKANGYGDLVKVEESAKWGELKKRLSFTGEIAAIADTGEIVEGVTAYTAPDTFSVDV